MTSSLSFLCVFANAVGEDWHTGGHVFHRRHSVPCQTAHAPTHCALNVHRRTHGYSHIISSTSEQSEPKGSLRFTFQESLSFRALFKNSIIEKYKTESWPLAWLMNWIFYLYICFAFLWISTTSWRKLSIFRLHPFAFRVCLLDFRASGKLVFVYFVFKSYVYILLFIYPVENDWKKLNWPN